MSARRRKQHGQRVSNRRCATWQPTARSSLPPSEHHRRVGGIGGVVGVVLAGGRGTRLGGRKPQQLLAGVPLITHPITALASAGLPVVVVTKGNRPLSGVIPRGVEVLVEPDAPQHPLCGIVHALRTLAARAIVAVACDMPFVPPPLLAALAAAEGTVAAVTSGALSPFPARWERSQLSKLEELLQRGASLRATLAACGCRPLAPACSTGYGTTTTERTRPEFFDVDTPADLVRAEAVCARLAPAPLSRVRRVDSQALRLAP